MDKIKKHQHIILSILEEHAASTPVNVQEVENQIIADSERNHYQLVSIGWDDDDEFIHQLIFHFDIKADGKIWIQANWTDVDIATEFIRRGVDRNDIVIGFQPPSHRPYTGYAVA